jgi:hypothetical protein
MSEQKQPEAVANKTPATPARASLLDRLGPALAIVICGGGFLSTGSLIHDSNMIVLGAVFCLGGVGFAVWRLMGK